MQCIYVSRFGGRSKLFPPETGADFWLKLTRTSPPLIDSTQLDIYDCTGTRDAPAPGRCEYRGPASDANLLDEFDPVGADGVDNHDDGGNVLRKSGDVTWVERSDPLWQRASVTTRP